MGHLVETPAAYPELTVLENLEIARRLQRITDKGVTSRCVESLGLGPYPGEGREPSPAGTSSGLPSPAPCCTNLNCSSLTNPRTGLIPPEWWRSASSWRGSAATKA